MNENGGIGTPCNFSQFFTSVKKIQIIIFRSIMIGRFGQIGLVLVKLKRTDLISPLLSGTVKVICRGQSERLTAIKRVCVGEREHESPLSHAPSSWLPAVICWASSSQRCWLVGLSGVKSFGSVFIMCVLWYEIDFWNNITFCFSHWYKEKERTVSM